jgi:hypothetical protein
MSSADEDQEEVNRFIRDRNNKEQSEAVYKQRWDAVLVLYSLSNEDYKLRWGKLNDLVNEFYEEDCDALPKRWKQMTTPAEWVGPTGHHPSQSPPPGIGGAAASSASLALPAGSAAKPPPAPPPVLLDSRFQNMETAVAGFVGANSGLEPGYLLLFQHNQSVASTLRDRESAQERAAKQAEAGIFSQLG